MIAVLWTLVVVTLGLWHYHQVTTQTALSSQELADALRSYGVGYGCLWLMGLTFTDRNRRRLTDHLLYRKRVEESLRQSEARYHSLFDNNHAVMLLTDPRDGSIVDANSAACSYYGYPLEQLKTLRISDINVLTLEEINREFSRARAEKRHRLEFRHRLIDGEIRDVAVYCGDITVGGQQLLYSIVHDISERKQAQLQLQKLSLAVEQSPAVVVITDLKANIEYANPKFTEITGYTLEEVRGKNPRILQSGEIPVENYRKLWKTLLAGKEWHGELLNKRKDGSLFWERASISPLWNDRGEMTHYICVKEDITAHKNHQIQMEYQATHDTLTGLTNRILLMDRLNQAICHAQRSLRMVAVLMFDLDRFKMVNDSLGHGLGDELLCLIARRLSSAVRDTDTVARFGGDEFVILLTEVAGVDDIRSIATKILQIIAEPCVIDEREITLTASLGISLAPRDGNDSIALIRNADIAMYQAKQRRNHYLLYSDEMNLNFIDTLELENSLRQAIERAEFELHYQPKVDIGSGNIDGCEALLRWRHPQRGLVAPGEFIPLAEETGLIVPIGTWALREACRQNLTWQAAGLKPVCIAVNLSARQFRYGNLAEVVDEILQDSGLDPALLELELTESMIMDNPVEAEQTLRKLKALGVSLSLDDFGTGYSSLNYLRRFPVDSLKIDRSFIHDVENDPTGASVVISIIDIAHNLNLIAIAEGVETQAQLDFLRECGCDSIQGYYFSKPLPADRFAELLGGDAGHAERAGMPVPV